MRIGRKESCSISMVLSLSEQGHTGGIEYSVHAGDCECTLLCVTVVDLICPCLDFRYQSLCHTIFSYRITYPAHTCHISTRYQEEGHHFWRIGCWPHCQNRCANYCRELDKMVSCGSVDDIILLHTRGPIIQ